MNKRMKKKLALKRETLRKLDDRELGAAAGGAILKTRICSGGDGQSGGTGGCTSEGCAGAIDPGAFAINPVAYKAY